MINGSYKITEGQSSDLDELERLYDELNDYLQIGINYPGYLKGIYPTRATAEWGLTAGGLFVLRVGGDIAGSVILNNHNINKAYRQVNWGVDASDEDIIIIYTLVVHPRYMKRGVATALMEHAEHYAKRLSAKSIRLDVAIQNTPAIALYEKRGYIYRGTVDLETGYDHLIWFKLYELLIY